MSVCIKDQIQNMNLVIGCTVGCDYCYARNNVRRYHMIDDFATPEFFPNKLRMMEKPRPQNFLLTGMSDLSVWKPEWLEQVFAKIRENPQHQFLFLSKRPDLLEIDTDLDNAWFGVTVTRRSELWRVDALRENVRAKHYHVTFEPMFDDPGTVDPRHRLDRSGHHDRHPEPEGAHRPGVGGLSDRAGARTGYSRLLEGRSAPHRERGGHGTGDAGSF